jgi:HlyD family secretion protein
MQPNKLGRWLLALGAGSILLLIAFRTARAPAIATVVPERVELVQTVVATGRVRSLARAQLGAAVSGTVARVRAREGDRVVAGQVLVELDGGEARAQLLQARAALARAEANLAAQDSVRAGIASASARAADVAFQTAERDYDRTRRLVDAGARAVQDLDAVREALEAARAQRDIARLQLSAARADGADARAALAQRAEAQGAVALGQARLDNTRIVAPGPGRILTRSVEPGDVVQVGRVLLTLALDGPTQLVAVPDEKDVARLAVGQRALASADAYPGSTFPATVAFVAPAIDPNQGTVEIRLDVAEPPDYLRPDLTVSIQVETGRSAAALALPVAAVQDAAGTAPWVLVLRDGRLERRQVEVGLRGEQWIEVRTGVTEGQTVALPPWRGLEPGDRARSVPAP